MLGGGSRIESPRSGTYTERGSVFSIGRATLDGSDQAYPDDQSFDVAVVQLRDDGSFADSTQLGRATDAIEAARALYGTGAVVVVFIHGWHHDAEWDVERDGGDAHFKAFRRVLMTLALRELERGPERSRRVVGVYLSWNGDPERSSFGGGSFLGNLSSWNRLRTADTVSRHEAIRHALARIQEHTKRTIEAASGLDPSPLIFIGHSMGALILERALLTLLRDDAGSLIGDRGSGPVEAREGVMTSQGGRPIDFPDLVMLLNSAAGSDLAREMGEELAERGIRREVNLGRVAYRAPLVISATSSKDLATRVAWRFANRPWRKAEGHDPRLRTHDLVWTGVARRCAPKPLDGLAKSFGQSWHCLRCPVATASGLQCFPIDLPTRTPLGEDLATALNAQHTRCVLTPVQRAAVGRIAGPGGGSLWMVRLPGEVSSGHNDIFNSRASLLILAMMQISGAIVSLAGKLEEVFEAEAP